MRSFDEQFVYMMEKNSLDTVLILGHMNPDGDAAGSVMGLAHYLKVNYPQYRIIPYLSEKLDKGPRILVEEDMCFHPFSIPQFGVPESEFSESEFPEPEFSEAKFLESRLLKSELPESDRMRYGVIVCDTATLERIIGREYYEKAVSSMVIDHHASNEGYGEWNVTTISEACADNVFHMVDRQKLEKAAKEEHPNAADYLYLGILHDTTCFDRANPGIFEAAGSLLNMGVDHRYVLRTMKTQTLADMEREAYLLKIARRAHGGKVAYVYLTREEAEAAGIGYEDIHPISGVLRDCMDIEMGFSMFEEEKDIWRCSFRSDGKWINVNLLVNPFGGGGHAGAAGLRLNTKEPEKLLADVLDRIEKVRAGK